MYHSKAPPFPRGAILWLVIAFNFRENQRVFYYFIFKNYSFKISTLFYFRISKQWNKNHNSESPSSLNISINPFLQESRKVFKVFLGFTTWFLSSMRSSSSSPGCCSVVGT